MIRFLNIALAIVLSLGALAGSPCRCDLVCEVAPLVDVSSSCTSCPSGEENTAPVSTPMGDCPPGMDCCEMTASHAARAPQQELPAPTAPLLWTPLVLSSAELPAPDVQLAPPAGHVPKSRSLRQLICIHRC